MLKIETWKYSSFNCQTSWKSKSVKNFYTLNKIPLDKIDMLSIVIIGNSKTTLVDGIFLTPRGYL